MSKSSSKSSLSHSSSLKSAKSSTKTKNSINMATAMSHIRAVSLGMARLKAVVSKTALKSYFDVKDNKDIVPDSSELKLAQYELEMLKGVARAALGRTGLRTRVYVKTVNSSTAGTALALVQGIIPSASAEWASFQSLFDDYKVRSAKTAYLFTSSVGPVSALNPSYCVAYDATFNSAPTSVVSLMESDKHQIGCLSAISNFPSSADPFSRDGFRHFDVKEPRAAIISPSAVTGGTGIVNNLPGSWIDMGDATSASSGYFKFYFEASTTSVVTLVQFLEYDVEFRQRT